jgi:predicted acylesterase/phospholipase RssA
MISLLVAVPLAFGVTTASWQSGPSVASDLAAATAEASHVQLVQAAPRKPQSKPAAQPKPAPQAKPESQQKKPGLPERKAFTEAEDQAAVIADIPDARFWADSAEAYKRAVPRGSAPWLLLSSGGADGAFGAGLLSGWQATGKRPDFAMITGVSTGALMAPFVFAGPKYDARLKEAYTTINAGDVFELGSTGESLMDTWPLKELIAKNVTAELLVDVAAEHRKGRRLFVVTTNLDAERPVAWNMGAIAEQGGDRALKLFRAVLLAATSIPGAFPPVLIDVTADGKTFQEMHGDGGLAAQFYLAPASVLSATSTETLPTSEIYVIVNTKLEPSFSVTERNLLSVLGRAVSVGVKGATVSMIEMAYATAKRSGVKFNLAYIDPSFNVPSQGAFDTEYMRALFEFGFVQGQKADAFRHEPSTPDGPPRPAPR